MKQFIASPSSTTDQDVASFAYSPAVESMPLLFELSKAAADVAFHSKQWGGVNKKPTGVFSTVGHGIIPRLSGSVTGYRHPSPPNFLSQLYPHSRNSPHNPP